MSALDWGIVGTLIGLIAGCYAYVRAIDQRETDARKELEDCIESEIGKLRESLTGFREDVIDRLGRIETGLNHVKKGVNDGHSE